MSKENSPLFGIECDAGFYTKAVPHVQYLPTRQDCPGTETLYSLKKYEELCKGIESEKKLSHVEIAYLYLTSYIPSAYPVANIMGDFPHASNSEEETTPPGI